jgi:molybdopterin-guanine dinucleotide biosynthesis protein A
MSSAAILAGGRASRFGGRDKGALMVDGRSIFDRQLAELSRLTDDILVVGRSAADALPASRHTPFRLVADRVADRGPLGGLDAALAVARDSHLVVVACDMPFVTAQFLSFLLSLTADHDIVVPRTERGYHPLCAVYARTCGAAVARRLAAGALAVRGLFEEMRVRVVTDEELDAFGDRARLLANVNTAAEYEELETLQGHRR